MDPSRLKSKVEYQENWVILYGFNVGCYLEENRVMTNRDIMYLQAQVLLFYKHKTTKFITTYMLVHKLAPINEFIAADIMHVNKIIQLPQVNLGNS